MRIGLLSDTHGSYTHSFLALDALGTCDMIIHLGDVLYHGPRNPVHGTYEPARLADYLKDKEMTYIRGNCDADVDAMVIGKDLDKEEGLFKLGPLVLYCVHGYKDSLEDRIQKAKNLGANTLCFGHTHVKMLEERDGLTIVNPGSTTLPKDKTPSCALYDQGHWPLIEL